MSTGNIPEVMDYLSLALDGSNKYQIKITNNYYELELDPLNDYHLKYALIDICFPLHNEMPKTSEYITELKRKVKKLSDKGFRIMLCNLWENSNCHSSTGMSGVLSECGIKKFYILGGARSYFWWHMQRLHIGQLPRLKHTNKIFDFLYFNKRPRLPRKYLFDAIKKKGLLENSLYTAWFDYKTRIKLPEEYEIPEYKLDYPYTGKDQMIYCLPYEHSKVNIVSETHHTRYKPDTGFITEKSWKPIICEQPFVIHAYQNFLSDLRAMGFKTFDSVWDESYDTIANPYHRADAIVKLLSRIRKLDYQTLYKQTEEIRYHNREKFFNFLELRTVIKEDVLRAFELN